MNITADAVKQLRERTGAGMMECKKALVETKGDLDAAADLMRKQGLAKADKKASRIAAEGVIVIEKSADGRSGAMVEVNCETDFVAREADFRAFAQAVVARRRAANARRRSMRCWPRSSTAARPSTSAVARSSRRSARTSACVASRCCRRPRISVRTFTARASARWWRSKAATRAVAYDVAMHVAASNPRYLDVAAIPADIVAKERGILVEQAQNEAQTSGKAKPADIIVKMVEGRLRKSLGEITLAGQPFVKDPDVTVEKLLKNGEGEGHGLRALRSGRRHREEAGRLRRRGDEAGRSARERQGGDERRRGQALSAAAREKPRPGGVFSIRRSPNVLKLERAEMPCMNAALNVLTSACW